MNNQEIKTILELHKKWLESAEGGQRADLQRADLQGTDLQDANLQGAYLQDADLRGTDLRDADLQDAYLRGANLQDADLRGTNNTSEAKGIQEIYMCPEYGAFTGFKKAKIKELNRFTSALVELQIHADAKRSSATSRKCRCDKATVVSIKSLDGTKDYETAYSCHDSDFIYRVGDTVSVDDFDDNRWNECSTGIHFFITKKEAIDY